MKTPTLSTLLAVLTLSSAALSCVTVNVNFPESSVQEATDDYVKELYKAKSGTKSSEFNIEQLLDGLLISSAKADELAVKPFTIDAELTQEVTERLSHRASDVLMLKSAGMIGEAQNGLLEKKGESAALAAKIAKSIKEENADREALYSIVSKSNNGMPIAQVRNYFAKSFKVNSPTGTWVQGSDGVWSKK